MKTMFEDSEPHRKSSPRLSRTSLLALALLSVLFAAPAGCMLPALEEVEGAGGPDATSGGDAFSGADALTDADAAALDTFASPDTVGDDVPIETPTGEASDTFKPVAQTLRTHCSTCHGPSPMQPTSNHFSMADGAESTDAQVWEAVRGVESSEGQALVVAGDADASELYRRLTLEANNAQAMPPGGWASVHFSDVDTTEGVADRAEEIAQEVHLWIDGGAKF